MNEKGTRRPEVKSRGLHAVHAVAPINFGIENQIFQLQYSNIIIPNCLVFVFYFINTK